jgi:hypothetical protein
MTDTNALIILIRSLDIDLYGDYGRGYQKALDDVIKILENKNVSTD